VLGPLVVFAGSEVAAAAVEVHLEDACVLVLSLLAGQAAEVRTDPAVAVIAHRMASVGVQRRERLVAVPEAEGPQKRVDQALGLVADFRHFGGAVAGELYLAIDDDAAVRCDLLNLGRTGTDVSEVPGLR